MTTDLVPVLHAASSFDLAPSAWSLAQRVAATDFAPRALRGKPEAVMAAMLTGHELGIGPMQALAKVHVIEGRPTMAAELMRAVILRAGHELWIEEATTTKATVGGRRSGSTRELRITWTLDDAKRAGIAGKDVWRKYPRAMLIARATAELARALFPDCLAGISYTEEELVDGDVVELVGEAPADATPAKPKKTAKAARAITPTGTPAGPEAPPLPEDEDLPPAATVSADDEVEEAEVVEDDPPAAQAPEAPPLPEDDYEGPDEHRGARGLAWHQMAAVKANEAGLTDEERHGLYLALTGGRTTRGVDLPGELRAVALDVIARIAAGAYALARIEDVWAVVDAEAPPDAAVVHASDALAPGIKLTVVAPAVYAGDLVPVSSATVGADPPARAPSAPSEPKTSAEEAPAPPSPASGHPTTEDDWRALMKERRLRVSDVMRIAAQAGADLDPRSLPGNIGGLVTMPELAAKVFERIEALG